jgi:hypothetical protein
MSLAVQALCPGYHTDLSHYIPSATQFIAGLSHELCWKANCPREFDLDSRDPVDAEGEENLLHSVDAHAVNGAS